MNSEREYTMRYSYDEGVRGAHRINWHRMHHYRSESSVVRVCVSSGRRCARRRLAVIQIPTRSQAVATLYAAKERKAKKMATLKKVHLVPPSRTALAGPS